MTNADFLIDARKRANEVIADLEEAGEFVSGGVEQASAAIRKVSARFPSAERPEHVDKAIDYARGLLVAANEYIKALQEFIQGIGLATDVGIMNNNPNYANGHIRWGKQIVTSAREKGKAARDATEELDALLKGD
jgi:hypothetical protein